MLYTPLAAGVVGPYLIGAVKTKYGGYTIPMVIMTAVNSLAVVYFAVLLRFLPRKAAKRTETGTVLCTLSHNCKMLITSLSLLTCACICQVSRMGREMEVL